MRYNPEELDLIARTRHIETEQDALGFALGLLISYAGDRARPAMLRRLGLEAHDRLIERASEIGMDLTHYDPIVALVRDALAVDQRDSGVVPFGDNDREGTT